MDASRARIARLRAALCLAGLIAYGGPARSDDGAADVAAPPADVASPTRARLWSLVPPERHEPPEVARGEWPLRRIDRFVLARLERERIEPAPPADRRALLRRLSFDLTGLPPSPEDVERFVRDPSPNAYERQVERLIASPHYGERWARLWLDVARYAEDQAHIVGNDRSLCYPNAWLYRDWVVGALNADLPYDRFVTLQLAADLVAKEEGIEDERPRDLPALGFLGLGPKYYNRGNPEVMNDEWEDRMDVVTRGLLGLTVACARCHDHKYDPITTADYYALAGVFASTRMANFPLDESRKTKKNGDTEKPEDAMHIVREGKPRDLKILIRGDVRREGDLAPRRFLSALSPPGEPILFTQGSGRLELARAIVDPRGPLAARVIVNRIWAAWFGRGIVATPSNFGVLGERPSHPELLDDLAVRFVENGWSLRWLHREIALSAAYRQSSIASEAALRVDPANVLLSHGPRKRLEVEAWRDAMLFASGALDLRAGGPSFDLSKPEERRRTLYGEVSRFELERLLVLFDFPDANVHASRRVHTTTPLQKLFSLNGPLLDRAAKSLSERLCADVPEEASPSDVASVSIASSGERAGRGVETGEASAADSESTSVRRVRRAWEIVYWRPPDAEEIAMAIRFLSDVERAGGDPWERLAHALLASNEAYFVD